MRPSDIFRNWPGFAFIALLLVGVEAAVQNGLVKRSLLPAPTEVAQVLWDLFLDRQVFGPLSETLLRLAVGFGIGTLVAVIGGIFLGYHRNLYEVFEPLIEFFRPIPKAALVPPLVLFLGVGDAMKVTSISLAVFFPIFINTKQGVSGLDPVLLQTARTLGASPAAIILKVILPNSLPFIFSGMRLSLSLGLIVAVISEMIAGTGGLGFLIIDMQRAFRVRQMYAWIVILAVVGYLLNLLLVYLEGRFLFWQQRRVPE